jgi:hypothetical protein
MAAIYRFDRPYWLGSQDLDRVIPPVPHQPYVEVGTSYLVGSRYLFQESGLPTDLSAQLRVLELDRVREVRRRLVHVLLPDILTYESVHEAFQMNAVY